MNKKGIIIGVVVVALILLVGIFNSNKDFDTNNLKIGVVAPLTGWAAYWGEDVKKAIDLAVEEINLSGGINGRNISVIYEDMGSIDLKLAASATNKLISIDGVDVIMTNFLEDTVVAAPITFESNVPIISIGAGNKGVSPDDILFRIRPYLEGVSPEESSRYFFEQNKQKPVVIYEDLPYYVNYTEETVEAWQRNHEIIPKTFAVSGDVRSSVLKAINSGADLIYLRAPTPTQIEAIKRIKEISSNITIEATEAKDPAFIDAGNITDGIFYFDYKSDDLSVFEDLFKSKYSAEAGLPAKLAYDAVYALKQALEDEEISTKNIIKGLSGIIFEGASGDVKFDSDQNRVIDFDRLQLYKKQNGEFIEVR